MTTDSITIRIRGRDIQVPAIDTGKYKLVKTGRFPRIAQLFDEELVESANFPDVPDALKAIDSGRMSAELFTFARPFDVGASTKIYPHVQDNLAVIDTESYDDWWKALPQESRKNMRLAAKRGVVVRAVEFDDSLVAGIKGIYDETPIRQGRRFWHYQKSLERVRLLNATYLDRSHFLGAYFDNELIGFIKYITVDRTAVLIQIIAKDSHREKRTVNALLRQAVESCHAQGLAYLTYGKFDYGVNQDSSLTEFKRRNGFRELTFPRYYVPLSQIGRLVLAVGLHEGWWSFVPASVRATLHRARARLLHLASNPASRGAR